MGKGSLTHLDDTGSARMVDVSAKPETVRQAVAEGRIGMQPATKAAILAGDMAKGDVLGTARLAGIMAAKKTAELVPLCHPLPIANVTVDIDAVDDGFVARARVRVTGQTGVEMEALTAVSVACLTIYDMAKALDKAMVIGPIQLIEKQGGASGDWRRDPARGAD